MAYFAYNVLEDLKSGEISGVMEAPSMELATLMLLNKGYLIRDIRYATNHDMQIARFKKLRNKLTGRHDNDLDAADWVMEKVQESARRRRSLPLRILFVGLVVLLLVAYIYLEKL